ncbi:MAG: hypothetical protein WCF18_15965, partial [Chthoniobacteraceae bacterium]
MTSLTCSRFARILPIISILLLHTGLCGAETAEWKWQEELVPELGFDLDAAQVVHVTSLDARGAGTLEAALKTKGP